MPGIHGVKKIEIHEDYVPNVYLNDLAILTLTKPFIFGKKKRKTEKGKLQIKNYHTKRMSMWSQLMAINKYLDSEPFLNDRIAKLFNKATCFK